MRILIWALPVALLGSSSVPLAQAVTLPHRYTIGGRTYYGVSITAARYIPGLPAEIKYGLSVLSQCPALSGNVFVSSSQVSAGVVGYSPNSLLACRSVVGGGPSGGGPSGGGPSGFSPCAKFFPTTNSTFPYAFIAATNLQTCIDLAFEVPGGVTVNLNTRQGVMPFLVKAQHYENGQLVDYLASPAASIPSSRNTIALYDSGIGIGPRSVIPLF